MGSPESESRHHATAARGFALAAALALGHAGCAFSPEQAPDLPTHAAPAAGALRIELAFGQDADLDLYVTDPLQETVYFANTPSQQGGVLLADRRCDAPAPRIETVVFDRPPPGRYRVGVDYPRRCRLIGAPVPFTVRVDAGTLQLEQRGEIRFPTFLPTVLEFDLTPENENGAEDERG